MKNPKRPHRAELPLAVLDQIDQICDRYERAWEAGNRPAIDDYLGEMADEFRSALLHDLVAAEVHVRQQRGERPEPRDYTNRFPADSSAIAAAFVGVRVPPTCGSSPPVAEANLLFGLIALQNGLLDQDQLVGAFRAWTRDKTRALADHLVARGDLDAADRVAILALAARHLKKHGGDAAKSLAAIAAGRSTIESLAGIGDPDIEYTLAHVAAVPTEHDGDSDRTASYAIGSSTSDGQRFRVLRPHARGGLGAVFVAQDAELHREVALKQILEQHADDPNSRQRFLLEAEITGGLEHPGIVPVYGLGTYGDGRPYYAMRFIRGDSLKEAIEHFHSNTTLKKSPGERRLELRKLVRRFTDVCNAIEYAHSRGVLHRDIKPGNIIVGKHGETLVVDWGLAKVRSRHDGSGTSDERPLMPASASGSVETLPGSALGTPAYMSPEQALGDLESLGPSSDVYSLGATLYCLLTGKPPVENDDLGQVLHAVQKGYFPPPRRLDPTTDRALEAVCLKAMALRIEERYSTPRALADDIERWMADEPVSAYREPWIGRARRWARRHRTTVVTSACLLVASVIGLTAGLVLLQAKQRETEAARTEAVTNSQTAVAARKDADAARQEAEANFERAMNAVETMLVRVSQKHLANLPQFEPVRRQLLEDSLGFYRDFLTRAAASPALVRQAAHAYRLAGDIHRKLGQRDMARDDLDKSLELLDRAPDSFARALEQAAAYHCRAEVDVDDRNIPKAIDQFQRALAIIGFLKDSPLETREQISLLDQAVRSESGLAGILGLSFRYAEAVDANRRARLALEQMLTRSPQDELNRYRLSTVEHNEAWLFYQQNDSASAVKHLLNAIRLQNDLLNSSPNVVHFRRDQANSYQLLGFTLGNLGRASDAIKAGRQAITLFSKLSTDYPTIPEYRFKLAAAHHNLGYTLDSNQDAAAAESEFRQSIESLEVLRQQVPESLVYMRDLATSHMCLGTTLRSVRRYDDSVREISLASKLFAELVRLQPDDAECRFQMAATEDNRSYALQLVGRLGEAVEGYRRSQLLLRELLSRDPRSRRPLRDLANSTCALGQCLLAIGERTQATAELTKALEILNSLIVELPRNADFLERRCRALVLLGRYDDALKSVESFATLPNEGEKNQYRAACVLAFNLPLPGRDPLAAARIPTDRAGIFADRAMGFLSKALAQGQSSPGGITIDEELDALRARSDFPSLFQILLDRGFPADPFAR